MRTITSPKQHKVTLGKLEFKIIEPVRSWDKFRGILSSEKSSVELIREMRNDDTKRDKRQGII